ncbi:MAG TPA: hypothetical protein VK797_22790 [Tepidisphaeraceae bacterium]|jgi:hypothetical protein|nr:hypothetical protein [Tepidisphaeraceae bacterium]
MAKKTWSGTIGDFNFATSGNWSPSGVPGNGDDLIFDATAVSAINGSDQTGGGVVFNTLTIYGTFGSSSPGTILFGSNGTPLKLNVTNGNQVGINLPAAAASSSTQVGCQRINLDLGTTSPIVNVFQANPRAIDTGKETVRIRANNAACDINVLGGSGGIGIATDNYTDTTTVGNVNVTGGVCNLGSGVTYSNVVNDGGQVLVNSTPVTALICFAGDLFTRGTYLVPTATCDGGTIHCLHRNAGAACITQLNLRNGGLLDLSQSGESFTITSTSLRNGRFKTVSDTQIVFTNGISPDFNAANAWSGQNS